MLVATLVLLTTLEATFAGYAGSNSNEVGNGYGYGFSGSYSGNGGNIPQPPIPNFQEFGGLLNGYFDSFRKYHEHFLKTRVPHSFALTSSSLSPSSSSRVQASSSIKFLPTRKSRLQQQVEQAGGQNPGYAPGFSAYGASNDGKGGNGGAAVASAALGPQGGYQGAAVYPENPNAPNIFTRFGGAGEGGPTGQGNYGVFTSSVSSSSNLDGKVHNFHRATTTINDNGKVTTYEVKNP
ncbi:uncharacterized protein LOC135141555 isoform X1 [Zophobas morio]|uniref:uncharacterized protein LOC135141555 isoform X1 n=1 Tax=Zophobas morio TaxID=2755281 RepID=UPI0030837FA3